MAKVLITILGNIKSESPLEPVIFTMSSHKCQNPGCSNKVDKPWFRFCADHARLPECKNPGCSNKVDKWGFQLCNYHYRMPECKNMGCNDRVDEQEVSYCQAHHSTISLEVIENALKDLMLEETTDNQSRAVAVALEDSSIEESHQGFVTDLVFSRKGKKIIRYNEMRFASQAEVSIAKVLEERQVLFFPTPLAVRYETGNCCEDHREPDFLVCYEGTWGILEVAYHTPERYEKDRAKSAWFKKSGLLCIEHYTAEVCLKDPNRVVDEFLTILAQHKR